MRRVHGNAYTMQRTRQCVHGNAYAIATRTTAVWALVCLLAHPAAVAVAAASSLTPPPPPVTMTLLPGAIVDPYYFGFCLEAYVGITMGLPFNDTAVVSIAKALHTGVLRYPGGTLSNLFDTRTGHYVLPAPPSLFPGGEPSCHSGTLGGGVLATQNTTAAAAAAWCAANPRCSGWAAPGRCSAGGVLNGVEFKDSWGAKRPMSKVGWS
jgi:hypothetical protein